MVSGSTSGPLLEGASSYARGSGPLPPTSPFTAGDRAASDPSMRQAFDPSGHASLTNPFSTPPRASGTLADKRYSRCFTPNVTALVAPPWPGVAMHLSPSGKQVFMGHPRWDVPRSEDRGQGGPLTYEVVNLPSFRSQSTLTLHHVVQAAAWSPQENFLALRVPCHRPVPLPRGCRNWRNASKLVLLDTCSGQMISFGRGTGGVPHWAPDQQWLVVYYGNETGGGEELSIWDTARLGAADFGAGAKASKCALIRRLPGPLSRLSFSWPNGESLLFKDRDNRWATVNRAGQSGAITLPDEAYPCGPVWVDDWSLLTLAPGSVDADRPHVHLVWTDPFVEPATAPSRAPTRQPIAEVLALSANHTRVAVITRQSAAWLTPLDECSRSSLQIFSLMRGPNQPPELTAPELTLELPHLIVTPVGDTHTQMWAPPGRHEDILSLAMRGEQVKILLVDTQVDRRRRAAVMQLDPSAQLTLDVMTRFTPDGEFFVVASPAEGAQPKQDKQLGFITVYKTADGACIFDYCRPIPQVPRNLQQLVAGAQFAHLLWQLDNELVVYDQSGRRSIITSLLQQVAGDSHPAGFRDPPRPSRPLTLYDLSLNSNPTDSSEDGSPLHRKLWCQAHEESDDSDTERPSPPQVASQQSF